ncbi:MAG: hypothetical protein KDD45_11130 [Bdellovibrionales bacterium]|nr:hypothetical protein [Bdellovibrionales bacterium]
MEKDPQKEYFNTSFVNRSKTFNNNSSKEYWAELNQSIKQAMKYNYPERDKEETVEHIDKSYRNIKLKETIARFKQHLKNEEE